MKTTTESLDPPLPNPEFIDEDPEEDDSPPDDLEVTAKDEPPRRPGRGRPRGARTKRRQQRRESPAATRSPERQDRLVELGSLDFDEWAAHPTWDWQKPRMKMILKRIEPAFEQGQRVSGNLDERNGSAFTMEEVRSMYGGGTFEAVIVGPDIARPDYILPLSRKRFVIPGAPLIDENQPEAAPRRGRGRPAAAADIQAKMLDVITDEVKQYRRRDATGDAGVLGPMQATYEHAMNEIKEAAESRATAREQSAVQLAQQSHVAMQHAQEEREAANMRLREMERDMFAKQETMRKEVAEQIQNAQGGSMQLLGAMLPQMQSSTQEQVRIITAQFEAREERLAAQQQAQINQVNVMNQMQLQSQQTNYEAQVRNLQTMHEGALTLHRVQIQNLQAERDMMSRQLEDVRRSLEEARKELMAQIMTTKSPKSPMDQISEMGAFAEGLETLKGIFGGGAGAGADEVSDDPMKNVFHLANKLGGPMIEAYLASKNGTPPPGGLPPQVYQPQLAPPRMPLGAVPTELPHLTPPPISEPVPPARKGLRKEDLVPALEFLDAVLGQPTPPNPEELARAATTQIDRNVLRELSRRDPEKVLEQLDEAGIMPPLLQSEKNQEYLKALLLELRKVV